LRPCLPKHYDVIAARTHRGGRQHAHGQYTTKQRSELVEMVTARQAAVSDAAARLGVTLSRAYAFGEDAGIVAPGPTEAGASRRGAAL